LLAPATVAVALLAASAWLAEPRVGYLAACALATVAAAVALWRFAPPQGRRPLALAVIALFVASINAGRAQVRLDRFARAPDEVGRQEAAAQRNRLRRGVDDELSALRNVARRARTLSTDARTAVRQLDDALGDREHRAAIRLHGDMMVAWAGTLHVDPTRLTESSGVVASPFGLTIYVADDSGSMRTIVASLLYAASPADHLTRGFAQRLGSGEVSEGFSFAPPTDSAHGDELRYVDSGRPLFLARAIIPSEGDVHLRLQERARVRVGIGLLIALLAFFIAVSQRGSGAVMIVSGALVVLLSIAIIPFSAFSTRSRLFDPSVFFLAAGRAYTSNAAALALTSATMLLFVLLAKRRIGRRMPRGVAVILAVLTIATGPFAVRALARGIAPPAEGAAWELWLIWNIPLCLAATALLVLAGWAGRNALGGRRGVPIWGGPTVALLAAVLAPLVWQAPGQWPQWYTILWALAVAGVVLARPSNRSLVASATVAALAATTVVWGSASRGRVDLAERDVRGLSAPDAYGVKLADRLASAMQGDELPTTAQGLLERYITSDLSSSGYPVALVSWHGNTSVAAFGSAPIDVAFDTVGMAAVAAEASQSKVVTTTRASVYGVRVIAVPMRGGAATILVAPKTRLIGADAYARWLGLASTESNEPPYTVQVVSDSAVVSDAILWKRVSGELHGNWPVLGPSGPARAHVEVDLRGLDSLLPRGGLLVLIDLFVVSLVWLLSAFADGRVGRWLRMRRRQIRSYRARLSVVLFLFFLVPAAAFAVWSWQQLFDDAQASRSLLVTETMRAIAGNPSEPGWLSREGRRLDTKLLAYKSGVLSEASDSLFADFAPMGRLLRPSVALALTFADELSATMTEPLSGSTGMLGYRVLPGTGGSVVLAAPARVDDFLLDRRRRDLGVLVLFATALGAAAALWLSAVAARQLARPIASLREAARAVARGESELPLEVNAVSEFLPVFSAFRAMARDLGESRAALVEAQRRTDAVLRTVASGVIAVDESGRVILANPQAEALLSNVPVPGEAISRVGSAAVAARVAAFLRSGQESDGFEIERAGRTLRGQLTCLDRGGAVLTLDDVTELARAQRVLAWGEMARQVAHEIKNPLTPIRLGVQHLRRAFGRPDFDTVLEQNVTRILTEIDRLDEIARAFSRYGSAPEEGPAPIPMDVAAIVRDVVALETLGEGSVRWSSEVMGSVPSALGRPDELREVLLNLFENARHAGAGHVAARVSLAPHGDGIDRVRIDVVDDGSGIAEDVLPKIFEPHFSTRTSGSGLGLAITRRLVEGWGGEVSIESSSAAGTTVRVALRPV
jgi:two-component system nitrogen regulation sensor histidine kinase NtrY